MDHLLFSIKDRRTEIRDKQRFFSTLGMKFDAKWIPLIGAHSQLFEESDFEGMSVFGRLPMELDIYSPDWISIPLQREKLNAHILKHLIIHKNEIRLLPLYRVLTSRFYVVQCHQRNMCFGFKFVPNADLDHIADISDDDTVNDSCFDESEYILNEEPFSYKMSNFKGVVNRIQCRNTKLFGDRDVWIQDFDASLDAKEKRMDLIVADHRGHLSDTFHPNNLLDGKVDTYYWSNFGSPGSDWIVFKQRVEKPFYPTKILIRNNDDNFAIQCICIYWSEDGESYHEMMQIEDIQQSKEEKQWFEMEEATSRLVLGKLHFIRVNILKSYSEDAIQGNVAGDCNAFYEFGIFGL